MNILIIGCGKVGSRLAFTLSQEGHDVSIIDQNEENFLLLDSDYSGLTTCGIPIDQDVLKRAGIENCDAVMAVSQNDNINIMVCQLAKEVFHIDKVIARIYDPSREDVFSHFGLHTVCPTNLTVSAIKTAAIEPHKPHSVQFGSHHISFLTVDIPKNFHGVDVLDLDFGDQESLFAVLKQDLSMIFFKGQHIILEPKDKLIVANLVD